MAPAIFPTGGFPVSIYFNLLSGGEEIKNKNGPTSLRMHMQNYSGRPPGVLRVVFHVKIRYAFLAFTSTLTLMTTPGILHNGRFLNKLIRSSTGTDELIFILPF